MDDIILIILSGLAQLHTLAPSKKLTTIELKFAKLSSLIGPSSRQSTARPSDGPLAPIPSGRGDASSRDHSVILSSMENSSIQMDFGDNNFDQYNIKGNFLPSDSCEDEWIYDLVPPYRKLQKSHPFNNSQEKFEIFNKWSS